MIINIKKVHPNAIIPKYAKAGDAGMDLTAVSMRILDNGNIQYHTGLVFEIPAGYVGLVFPRSSVCKKDLTLTNSVGVIDSGYRGTVNAVFKCTGTNIYEVGERICQMVIIPHPMVEFEEVEELSDTDRGDGGFGSTGK